MLQEIRSKWTVKYKDWNLAITADKEVYDVASKQQLVTVWNNGSISYRKPKEKAKIGTKTINKHCIKKEIVIQHYIPF